MKTLISSLVLFLAQAPAPALAQESVVASVCRLIERAAQAEKLPADYLTKLIWQESRFNASAVSPKGAQGMAQFMPGTAAERGLADPFDPEQAIPKAANLLGELRGRFGNLGLAAAAYNAGPQRVADWLSGKGGMPAETRNYVMIVTGAAIEDWRDGARAPAYAVSPESCEKITAALKQRRGTLIAALAPTAPWGVQLAGNFSKAQALASFARARTRLAGVLGDVQPMVIGSRLRSRGTRAFYRVRVPAQTRAEAQALCAKIQKAGGACAVLRSTR
ncbi:MAG: lytic transglycosylase domain-containing protein [Rhodoblastus sp.]